LGLSIIRHAGTLLLPSLLVAFIFGSVSLGQTDKVPEETIQVSVALDHKEFHLGDPMELRLEISNVGPAPLLVANSVSFFGNSDAFLEIELHNQRGPVQPHIGMAVDCFPTPVKDKRPPSDVVLKSFLVLRPRTSYVQKIALYEHLSRLEYELKPGKYTVTAYYSSRGLFYPSMCGTQGLTEEDVRSLPFETWHGKVRTNKISFTVLPPRPTH
jgi:hypothetical protein